MTRKRVHGVMICWVPNREDMSTYQMRQWIGYESGTPGLVITHDPRPGLGVLHFGSTWQVMHLATGRYIVNELSSFDVARGVCTFLRNRWPDCDWTAVRPGAMPTFSKSLLDTEVRRLEGVARDEIPVA